MKIGLGTALKRGFGRKCPRCGQGRAFRSYFKMGEACLVCGYRFEREAGYWTGAMIVNIAVAEIWFFALFVGTIVMTAPDVNWGMLLLVGLLTNGALPVVFYPFSKTLWMALDLHFHPLESDEV